MRPVALASLASLGLAVAAGGGLRLASAETPQAQAARAQALFEEGRGLATAGKVREACARFEASYDLDAALGTLLNLADCHEKLGHLGRAWWMFDRVARQSTSNAARARFARERATALEGRLGTVIVRVGARPLDAVTLNVGGFNVPAAAEVVVHVDAGDVAVIATTPRRYETSAHVAVGQVVTVEVPGAAPAVAAAPRARGWVIAAAVAGAGGTGALVASGVLAVSAVRNYHDAYTHGLCFATGVGAGACTPEGLAVVERSHRRAAWATATFAGGAALVAAGLAAYVWAPRAGVEVAPVAGGGHVGVAVGGRF